MTDTVYTQIPVAMAAVISALEGAPPVEIRDIEYRYNSDQLPVIVIVPVSEQDKEANFGNGLTRSYTLGVLAMFARNHNANLNADDAAQWRTRIAAALRIDNDRASVLSGVSEVWDCNITNMSKEDERQFAAGYGISGLVVEYLTNEGANA